MLMSDGPLNAALLQTITRKNGDTKNSIVQHSLMSMHVLHVGSGAYFSLE